MSQKSHQRKARGLMFTLHSGWNEKFLKIIPFNFQLTDPKIVMKEKNFFQNLSSNSLRFSCWAVEGERKYKILSFKSQIRAHRNMKGADVYVL